METKPCSRFNSPRKFSSILNQGIKSPGTIIFLSLISVLIARQDVFAAAGSITAVPDTGSFSAGSMLNVAVKVDGGGVAFNAAKATVSFAPSAPVQSIQIGDCGFAYIKTPTTSDPSFVGVILGGSTTSCTAYTMRFQAASAGTQLVNITDASIKSYQGAKEELNSVKGGSFTITQSSTPITPIITSPVGQPATDPNGNRLYSVAYSVNIPKNTPPEDVKILLDSRTSPSKVEVAGAEETGSESVATATFEDVPEGTHTLSVVSDDKKISEQIVYLDGDSKNLAFGNKPEVSSPSMWYIGGIIAAVLLIVGVVAGVFLYKRHKNNITPQAY